MQNLAQANLSKRQIAMELLPHFTLDIIRRYHRVEVFGTQNLPKKGASIVVSNHSGYAGFDAMMLQHEIRRATQRTARLVAHKLWFVGEHISTVSGKMGLIPADTNACIDVLRAQKMLVLFPEGEAGNFKPSHRRYRLQEFKRGFVRLAMITGAPIVPSFVIGAEETHLNLAQIKFSKYILGTVLPVPVNVLPMPVRWSIHFGEPIYLENVTPADAMDREKVFQLTKSIKRQMQIQMIAELRRRKSQGWWRSGRR